MTQVTKRSRPMGVTILAVLQLLVGVGALFLGLGSMVLVGMVGAYAPTTASAGILGALGSMMGVIFVLVALVSFVIAWGYLGGKSWARIIGLVFAGLDGLYGILTLPGGLITVIIATIMIYYLTRPQVLEWFSPNPVTTT